MTRRKREIIGLTNERKKELSRQESPDSAGRLSQCFIGGDHERKQKCTEPAGGP
jgi:hypothetical protein